MSWLGPMWSVHLCLLIGQCTFQSTPLSWFLSPLNITDRLPVCTVEKESDTNENKVKSKIDIKSDSEEF